MDRAQWSRTSFEALRKFGVHAPPAGTVAMLTDTAVSDSSLLTAVMQGVLDDAFLAPVARRVKESDNDTWRGFFTAPDSTLRYQREGDATARICVPSKCRGAVMRASHGGDLLTGHPGIDRTLAEIARYWYWPSLAKDVAHFCRSCRVCAGAKSSNQRRLGVDAYSEIPLFPFTQWSMDLISMPPSKQGNDLIVTWVDRPVHDNDVRFKALWKEIWQAIGTHLSFPSSYNPQSDPAERANRQVLEALRAAASSVCHYDAWDDALPHLCFGLNNHVCDYAGDQSSAGGGRPDGSSTGSCGSAVG